jgi:hypothetical protein
VNGREGDTRKCLNTLRKEERIPISVLLEIRAGPGDIESFNGISLTRTRHPVPRTARVRCLRI